MTQAAKHAIEDLPALRLPELQAYYAEVIGETTRCPNKKFLVRRITETLAEQAERQVASEEPAQPEPAVEAVEVAEAEPAAQPDTKPAKPEPKSATEHAEPAEPEQTAEPATEDTEASAGESGASADKPFTKLTVEELQQRYQDVVGRSTGSSHRRYLTWKIRQAQKGKVPVGPRSRRNPDEPAPEFKVLPLRMEANLVQRLDEARERLGLKNRMDLFRSALQTYFSAQGETDVAALFTR